MDITPQQASLLLARLPQIGVRTAKKLIDCFGSALQVFSADPTAWEEAGFLSPVLHALRKASEQLPAVERELLWMDQHQLRMTAYGDENYPSSLAFTADPPAVVFHQGTIDFSAPRVLSIVGTRNPTRQGIAMCQKLVEALAVYQPIIVSGFARGVDIAAHRAALKVGLKTVGVLGHAFGRWYPPEHQKYVGEMTQGGGFLSEFWSDNQFHPSNFLRRNRIIAGWAHATLVIESGEKGGSLVTARQALSYGREVFAFPGRLTDQQSQGCLRLIAQDGARLFYNPEQFADWMGWRKKTHRPTTQKQLPIDLSPEEEQLWTAVASPQSLDHLIDVMQRPPAVVAGMLLQMELKGLVRALPGKRFEQA